MAALRRLSGLFGAVNNYYLKPVTATILNNNNSLMEKSCRFQQFRELKTHVPWIPNRNDEVPTQMEIPEPSEHEEKLSNDVLTIINNQLATNRTSRLFAIVHICGKQFKVTENDLVIVQGYWPPNPGDKMKLEKVLLIGGTDFTLVGQPILNREMANVEVTVIEKTFSHTKTRFYMIPRKQYRRTHFLRVQHTMIRINSINVRAPIDVKKEVEGLERIY